MDQDAPDPAGGDASLKPCAVLLGIGGRPPRARRLVEDLDRLGTERRAALDRLPETAGCRDVGAQEDTTTMIRAHATSICSLSDRRASHRRRPHGSVQLVDGTRQPADGSYCGSKIPTGSGRRRRTSSRSSTPCAGSSSTGTRVRSCSPAGPSATARWSASCSTRGHAYRSTATADDVREYKRTPRRRPGVPRQAGGRGRGPAAGAR